MARRNLALASRWSEVGGRWHGFVGRPRNVVLVGIAMIAVQLGYRTWALSGGWFLIDDYGFLSDVTQQDHLTLSYLFQVHNDHLQPLGFLIVWVVGHTAPFNWGLATAITMVLQALASGAALVFLLRLSGRRWSVLIPLGFYLFSVVTLPGFMWWCVAMMQVPQQLAAFAAMALHVEYIRTRRLRFVPLTALALALGMLCDVKVGFVAIALVFLSLYLSDARGVRQRLLDALWRQRTAWLVYGSMFVGYLVLYLTLNPVEDLAERQAPDRLGVFEVMLRFTMGPTFLGGPWEWGPMTDTPLVPAQSPEWAITLTWVCLVLLLIRAIRRCPATAWALVPFFLALVVNVLMVSTARGAIFGKVLGFEVRYIGDLAPTLTLVVAVLATGLLPTRASPTDPAPLPPSQAPSPVAVGVGAVLVVVALAGSFVSTSLYVDNWHSDYPARKYVQNVIRQTRDHPLVVVDQPVPLTVMPRDKIVNAFDSPSELFRPLGGRVIATLEGNDLDVLDERGVAYPASVLPHVVAPAGPAAGCGYKVGTRPATAPLEPVSGATPPGAFWWGSISYLASADGTVSLSVGSTDATMSVKRGLHTFLFLGSGDPQEVRLSTKDDLVVCVATVHIGDLVPFKAKEAS
jgi:hypothetical protein